MLRLGLWLAVLVCTPFLLGVPSAQAIPIANTVEVLSDEPVPFGSVIRYDEDANIYQLSAGRSDPAVYGVTAERPTVVYVTTATAVPVVHEGAAQVLVSLENGPIARGDVLTTANTRGQAMRADVSEPIVFAVALEAATEPGLVLAHIGSDRAQIVQEQRAAITAEGGIIVSTARAILATVLVLGAVGFLLYSFRSIMTTGVISIGRNPRARRSVLWVSIGSMILAIVLVVVVIFTAIGILILPV